MFFLINLLQHGGVADARAKKWSRSAGEGEARRVQYQRDHINRVIGTARPVSWKHRSTNSECVSGQYVSDRRTETPHGRPQSWKLSGGGRNACRDASFPIKWELARCESMEKAIPCPFFSHILQPWKRWGVAFSDQMKAERREDTLMKGRQKCWPAPILVDFSPSLFLPLLLSVEQPLFISAMLQLHRHAPSYCAALRSTQSALSVSLIIEKPFYSLALAFWETTAEEKRALKEVKRCERERRRILSLHLSLPLSVVVSG